VAETEFKKLGQQTTIKQSVIAPPQELDPTYHVEMVGNKQQVVAQQELIERRERERVALAKKAERDAHRAEWDGLSPAQVLMAEMLKQRPALKGESTFSIHPNAEGDIDVHLYGNVYRVLEHVVKHSDKTVTWHITAKGVIDRLRRMAVQPSRPLEVKQSEIYQEQADMLRELALVGGLLEDPNLQVLLQGAKEIKDDAVRSKTEVTTLFIHLRKRLGELACQTSQPPQPSQSEETAQEASPQKPRRRRRRPASQTKSPRRRPKADPAVNAEADSPTT
jgi:hypothetical protein